MVCDSGYESIENYTYLEKKKLESYIKPSNYEISKKRTYKTDISKRENMIYDKEGDFYICANGKKLTRQKDYIKTRKSGFKESIKIYKCFECDKCIYQKSCNKYSKSDNPQTKSLRFNAKFIKYREQSYANITSAEGIDERLNRSIQAEGMFSKLKEGLNYNRFRHRGLRAVICDIHLIAMGMNLNQLHRKLLKNQTEVIKYRKAV
ncbi:transposase [Peptoniphilus asaccharolyticus]